MKIDLKLAAPYIVILGGFLVSWGMWGEKISALEKERITADQKLDILMEDMAVVKEKLEWIEEYLIKTSPY